MDMYISKSHEVLTKNGWLTYDQIDNNTEIAISKDGNLTYSKPISRSSKTKHDGVMYAVNEDLSYIFVSEGHGLCVASDGIDYNAYNVEDCVGKSLYIQKHIPKNTSANYKFSSDEFSGERKWNADQWITLVGIWYGCDGCFVNNKCMLNENAKTILNMNEIEFETIQEIPQTIARRVIQIKDQQLMSDFKNLPKCMPSWCTRLSLKQSRLLLIGLIYADHVSKILSDQVLHVCINAERIPQSFHHMSGIGDEMGVNVIFYDDVHTPSLVDGKIHKMMVNPSMCADYCPCTNKCLCTIDAVRDNECLHAEHGIKKCGVFRIETEKECRYLIKNNGYVMWVF